MAKPTQQPTVAPGNMNFRERRLSPDAGMSVILLGTGTPVPNPARACASTLVTAGMKKFLIDTGRGFLNNFTAAGFQDVDLVLFTHFHSDHIGEFCEFMVNRAIAGPSDKLAVTGPKGVKEVIGSMVKAYSRDEMYRRAHHGDKWGENTMKVSINEAESGVIYDEDGVKITMFEVCHLPVTPAVGYRLEYDGQSIVVSGDTMKVPRMVEMAKGCDILVHEAANDQMTMMAARTMLASKDESMMRLGAMAEEMITYHTLTREVAEIARDADVKKLVLTHLVPSIPVMDSVEKLFVSGMDKIYKGPIEIGRDGMEIKA